MNAIKLFFPILILSLSCQPNQKTKKDEKQHNSTSIQSKSTGLKQDNLIGFACFTDGSKSRSVELFSKLLTKKDYTKIRSKLGHENPAEKYLASIVCLRLQEKKMIELSSEEQKQIKANKRSFDLVSICSGCTNREERTVLELFEPNMTFLNEEIEVWLKEFVK